MPEDPKLDATATRAGAESTPNPQVPAPGNPAASWLQPVAEACEVFTWLTHAPADAGGGGNGRGSLDDRQKRQVLEVLAALRLCASCADANELNRLHEVAATILEEDEVWQGVITFGRSPHQDELIIHGFLTSGSATILDLVARHASKDTIANACAEHSLIYRGLPIDRLTLAERASGIRALLDHRTSGNGYAEAAATFLFARPVRLKSTGRSGEAKRRTRRDDFIEALTKHLTSALTPKMDPSKVARLCEAFATDYQKRWSFSVEHRRTRRDAVHAVIMPALEMKHGAKVIAGGTYDALATWEAQHSRRRR